MLDLASSWTVIADATYLEGKKPAESPRFDGTDPYFRLESRIMKDEDLYARALLAALPIADKLEPNGNEREDKVAQAAHRYAAALVDAFKKNRRTFSPKKDSEPSPTKVNLDVLKHDPEKP
jgi:hypothetical protein